jgi:hypothetical protein
VNAGLRAEDTKLKKTVLYCTIFATELPELTASREIMTLITGQTKRTRESQAAKDVLLST